MASFSAEVGRPSSNSRTPCSLLSAAASGSMPTYRALAGRILDEDEREAADIGGHIAVGQPAAARRHEQVDSLAQAQQRHRHRVRAAGEQHRIVLRRGLQFAQAERDGLRLCGEGEAGGAVERRSRVRGRVDANHPLKNSGRLGGAGASDMAGLVGCGGSRSSLHRIGGRAPVAPALAARQQRPLTRAAFSATTWHGLRIPIRARCTRSGTSRGSRWR